MIDHHLAVTFDPSRCSRQEACDKWEESQHFNTRLDQCVDISVTPSNMSVTSPATQVRTHTGDVLIDSRVDQSLCVPAAGKHW